MVVFFFIPKNILYFRTEQVGGVGVVGIVFTIVLFYDHLIELVS